MYLNTKTFSVTLHQIWEPSELLSVTAAPGFFFFGRNDPWIHCLSPQCVHISCDLYLFYHYYIYFLKLHLSIRSCLQIQLWSDKWFSFTVRLVIYRWLLVKILSYFVCAISRNHCWISAKLLSTFVHSHDTGLASLIFWGYHSYLPIRGCLLIQFWNGKSSVMASAGIKRLVCEEKNLDLQERPRLT